MEVRIFEQNSPTPQTEPGGQHCGLGCIYRERVNKLPELDLFSLGPSHVISIG